MKDLQYITNSSPSFIESLYQDFVKDPQSVDPEFKKFFEGFDFAITQGKNGNGQAVDFQRDQPSKPPTGWTGRKSWALTG